MFNIGNANNTIYQFRESFSSRGFQSANRYLVKFKRNSGPDQQEKISYPESAILPEKQIETTRDSLYTTGRDIPISSSQGSVLLSFITMKDWQEREYFENWMNNTAYGTGELGKSAAVVLPYNQSSSASMNIIFYDENTNAITYNYAFYEVYPQSMTPTSFESSATGYASFQVLLHARSRNFNYRTQ
jgi:hypothetical protein